MFTPKDNSIRWYLEFLCFLKLFYNLSDFFFLGFLELGIISIFIWKVSAQSPVKLREHGLLATVRLLIFFGEYLVCNESALFNIASNFADYKHSE